MHIIQLRFLINWQFNFPALLQNFSRSRCIHATMFFQRPCVCVCVKRTKTPAGAVWQDLRVWNCACLHLADKHWPRARTHEEEQKTDQNKSFKSRRKQGIIDFRWHCCQTPGMKFSFHKSLPLIIEDICPQGKQHSLNLKLHQPFRITISTTAL